MSANVYDLRGWTRKAACLGRPDLMDGDGTPDGLALCARCEVREMCLADAVATESDGGTQYRDGLRGGLTPQERARAAGARR